MNPNQALMDVLKYVTDSEHFFILRDEMNSKLHLDTPRYSNITKAASTARQLLESLLKEYDHA